MPAGSTAFVVPSSGWSYGNACSAKQYVIWSPEPGCDQEFFVLCVDGAWSYGVCGEDAPSGYTVDPKEFPTVDAGDPNSYPDCLSYGKCDACNDLEVCCMFASLPNAGVCDHTDWDGTTCESLLNKYPVECTETCSDGKCTNLPDAGDDGGASTGHDAG